jgi:hypothetical protein
MATLSGYAIVNGTAKNYPYNKEVETQKEIDKIRQDLHKFYGLDRLNEKIQSNNDVMGTKDSYYEICFFLKKEQSSKLIA